MAFELTAAETFDFDQTVSKQEEKTDPSGWKNIGKLPDKLEISNPVQINNNEFIVATSYF